MADVPSAGMRVGEAAEVTGQTPRALRYYDRLGLAGPSQHSAGGHRLYTPADIRRLCAVALLRTVGLSIAEIATVLDSPTADLNAVINQQLDRLEETMTELGTLRGRLRAVVGDPTAEPAVLLARARVEAGRRYLATKAVALLPYPDVAAGRDWLVEVFGFEPGPTAEQGPGYASVITGQGVIHLHPAYDALQPPGPGRPPTAMIVITVDDIDRMAARIREHGVPIDHGPVEQPYGVRELIVADLVGHPWCFHEPLQRKDDP